MLDYPESWETQGEQSCTVWVFNTVMKEWVLPGPAIQKQGLDPFLQPWRPGLSRLENADGNGIQIDREWF